jgi:hypothetical protein
MKLTRLFFAVAIVLTACKGNQTGEGSDVVPVSENAEGKVTVLCISEGTATREEPKKDGKWVSSLSLGETMEYLDKTEVDPTDEKQEFAFVRLSDGKEVWARTYGVLIGAKPAAIISQTPVYKRPDLVNKTDKMFKMIEFVGVITEKDDWVEVVGANKTKKGWIKRQMLSFDQEDIAVATMAYKSLLDKNGDIMTDKVAQFLEGIPYPNSQFTTYLQTLLDNEAGAAIEESIDEYESSDGTSEETTEEYYGD